MKNFYLTILILFIGCELINPPKEPNNNSAIVALLLASRNQAVASNCTQASTTAISNPGKVSTASRTDYVVSGCSSTNLSSIGFSGDSSVTSGMTGISTLSRILSNGDIFGGTDADRNIEITFRLNSSTSYLDIVTRASGSTASSFDGSTIRITPSDVVFRNSGAATSTTTPGNGTAIASAVGTTLTYCLDAHLESGASHLIVWSKSCTSLTTAERGSYPKDAEPITSSGGNKLGFILNGATITNFKVGTKIGTAGRILE
jgi:hypothetical protein